jgi:hypothetical protein
LRHVAADAGDVLVADFGLASSKVGLKISDINTIAAGEDLGDA